jgi:hypothetical protein
VYSLQRLQQCVLANLGRIRLVVGRIWCAAAAALHA